MVENQIAVETDVDVLIGKIQKRCALTGFYGVFYIYENLKKELRIAPDVESLPKSGFLICSVSPESVTERYELASVFKADLEKYNKNEA